MRRPVPAPSSPTPNRQSKVIGGQVSPTPASERLSNLLPGHADGVRERTSRLGHATPAVPAHSLRSSVADLLCRPCPRLAVRRKPVRAPRRHPGLIADPAPRHSLFGHAMLAAKWKYRQEPLRCPASRYDLFTPSRNIQGVFLGTQQSSRVLVRSMPNQGLQAQPDRLRLRRRSARYFRFPD